MSYKAKTIVTVNILFWMFIVSVQAQKVGLVLSGGGALGWAHIGVLKALEENNIPIDYITGTSAGGLVGGFYAGGFTPVELQNLVLKETELWLAPGMVIGEQYYFKKNNVDGTFIQLPISFRGVKRKLPESLFSDYEINIGFNKYMAGPSAAAGHNFDSLFVPYRCMTADIFEKRSFAMSHGSLAFAMRSTMAVPFFFPSSSNGEYQNLFDGGIYDNFPVRTMKETFAPDIIIGVHVGGSPSVREEVVNKGGMIRELLANALIENVIWEKMPPNGILIMPDLTGMSSTNFSTSAAMFAIEQGYQSTIACMEDIKAAIIRRVDSTALANRRAEFKKKIPPLVIDSVRVHGVHRLEQQFVQRLIRIKPGPQKYSDIRDGYLRLRADGNYQSSWPEVLYNPATGKYDIDFYIKPSPRFSIKFGGCLFTPTDHQIEAGIKYHGVSLLGYEAELNLVRGSFTNLAKLRGRLDFPTKKPFIFEFEASIQQWDLQSMRFSLFNAQKSADVSFESRQLRANFALPLTLNSKFSFGYAYQNLTDRYFDRAVVYRSDTLDKTFFNGNSLFVKLEKNSLDRKMYPRKGSELYISAMYNFGKEDFTPGSVLENKLNNYHKWFQSRISYRHYFRPVKRFTIGLSVEGAFSTLDNYLNYKSTLLSSPKFEPLQDGQIVFLERLYSKAYGAAGIQLNVSILEKLVVRAEAYYMHSFWRAYVNADHIVTSKYELSIKNRYYAMGIGIYYDTAIGPIGIFGNFYDNPKDPVRLLIHVGYMIFAKHPWY